MNRATKKAFEEYPLDDHYDELIVGKRIGYAEGYEQASEDIIDWVKKYILNHDDIDIFMMEDEFKQFMSE